MSLLLRLKLSSENEVIAIWQRHLFCYRALTSVTTLPRSRPEKLACIAILRDKFSWRIVIGLLPNDTFASALKGTLVPDPVLSKSFVF